MPRGGRRPNQTGCPKGARTIRTREIAVQAALTGQTPLEVMLEAMRYYQAVHADPGATVSVRVCAIDKAAAIAKDAAPYMHPRLTSVDDGGKPGAPIETKDVSLPDLARRLAFIFNQAALEERAGLIEGTGDGGA
jgi:hypothetical protein